MHETTKVYDTMKPLKVNEVLTAVNAQITALWAVMSCSLTAGYQLFGVIFYLEYGGSRSLQNGGTCRLHSITSCKTANFRSSYIWDKL